MLKGGGTPGRLHDEKSRRWYTRKRVECGIPEKRQAEKITTAIAERREEKSSLKEKASLSKKEKSLSAH